MADTEQRYSENESLDRILRSLLGDTLNEAPETLSPPKRSKNESLSQIAEVLDGNLEGEEARLPTAFSKYGAVYTSNNQAGTAQSLASGTATKVTGFAGVTDASSITPSHTSDQLTIGLAGAYMIGYDIDFAGATGTLYRAEMYRNGAADLYHTNSQAVVLVTGIPYSMSAQGPEVLAAGDVLTLYATAYFEDAHFSIQTGQMFAYRV